MCMHNIYIHIHNLRVLTEQYTHKKHNSMYLNVHFDVYSYALMCISTCMHNLRIPIGQYAHEKHQLGERLQDMSEELQEVCVLRCALRCVLQ